MKTQISAAALALIAAIGLPMTAHADWGDHGWWGHRGYHRSTIYITPPPVVVGRPYHHRVYEGREVRGSVEMDVQAALRRRGYYYGPIDGDIGPGTRAAIRSYQRDHDLRITGTITNSLLDRLGL